MLLIDLLLYDRNMKEVSNEILFNLWVKEIPRFRYYTTEEWKVFSYTKRTWYRELHPFYDKYKLYNVITICWKKILLHRLILMNYVKQPPNMLDCNHKNWIKTDNRLENLERCNESYNILEAQRLWLKPTTKIYQFSEEWKLLKVWDSISQAEKVYWYAVCNAIKFKPNWVMYTRAKWYRWSKENKFPESKITKNEWNVKIISNQDLHS